MRRAWSRGTGKRWRFYLESLAEQIRTLVRSLYFCDLAMKVVGVGSVGTLCSGVVLLMASDDEPIFLLARAHARSGDAMIAGYTGASDNAIAEFAVEHVDQTH